VGKGRYVRRLRRCGYGGLFGASLAGYEDADALDHFGGRTGALGQEDIGVQGAIEGVDGSGDDQCGQALMELFGAANQFVAVHLRHEEIAQDQIECAGKRTLEDFDRFLGGFYRDDTVATSFEKEGADGEHLFVVIYAEDRFLGAHAVSLLPDATLWWLAADKPVWRVCWFAGTPSGGVQIAPWPGRIRPSARDGSSAPGELKTKERGSPDCSTGDQVHLVRRARLPNRGVRERLYAVAGCHAAPEGKGSLCCGYVRIDAGGNGIRPQCVCRQRGCAWGVTTAMAVKLLSTQIVRKQAKAIFIFNNAARCMQRRRQRFPTVRTVG
jgi:hypothetical protein